MKLKVSESEIEESFLQLSISKQVKNYLFEWKLSRNSRKFIENAENVFVLTGRRICNKYIILKDFESLSKSSVQAKNYLNN